MAAKTFEQVLDEVRGKPILVANRGIPARRICRAIRERFAAVPVMTATDIDKAAPAASSAQELLLLGSDPRAYLDLDLIIASFTNGVGNIFVWVNKNLTEKLPEFI